MSTPHAAARAAALPLLIVVLALWPGSALAQNPLKPRPYGLGQTTADSVRYYSERLMSENPAVQASAFDAVEAMGKRAESLAGGIALLTTHLDPDVRVRAAHTLTTVAPPEIAVPALRDLCADTVATVRTAAYDAIEHFGPKARATLPRLRHGAAGSAAGERTAAESAIASVRTGAKATGKKITDADAGWIAEDLGAVSPIMRSLATDGLSDMGPDAAVASPALIKALTDGDLNVRRKAGRALLRISPNETKTRAALLARVADSTEVLETRVEFLRRTGGSSPALLQATAARLLVQLESHDDGERHAAVSLLGEFPSPQLESVAALSKRLEDPSTEVRVAAANSLGSLGPAAKDALPALKAAVRGTDPRLRRIAEVSIARIEQ